MEKLIFNDYIINECGEIYSTKRKKKMTHYEKDGYKMVKIIVDKKPKSMYVHKLVAMAFIDQYKDNDTVSFIDYNRSNVKLSNLRLNSKNEQIELIKGKRKKILSIYEIDSNGYVVNAKTNKVMNAYHSKNGFPRVYLNVGKKIRALSLPVIVAKAFIDDYNEVNDSIVFKNGNINDCSVDNLTINKNSNIKMLPTKEMTDFYESQNPYKIVDYYVNYLHSMNRFYGSSWAFQKEDLRQYLAEYLWKKTPHYFMVGRNKTLSYKNYAFTIFNNLLKNKVFWKHVTSFYGVVETAFNTFDFQMSSGSFISIDEYIREVNNFKEAKDYVKAMKVYGG